MEVSLIIVENPFIKAGIATRIACGSTMYRFTWNELNPRNFAASYCPLSTDRMAPRTFSELYPHELCATSCCTKSRFGFFPPASLLASTSPQSLYLTSGHANILRIFPACRKPRSAADRHNGKKFLPLWRVLFFPKEKKPSCESLPLSLTISTVPSLYDR